MPATRRLSHRLMIVTPAALAVLMTFLFAAMSDPAWSDDPAPAAASQPSAVCGDPAAEASSNEASPLEPTEDDPYAWRNLFDGRTLAGWEKCQFGGDGEVYVEDNAIVMAMGNDMTGIRRKDGIEKVDYELQFDGKRTDGVDFFCTPTVPYRDSFFSLVVGGWGGGVVGISSIDHYDAANNETARFMTFKKDTWYRVRLRVTEKMIEAWIHQLDDEGKPIRDEEQLQDGGDERVVCFHTLDHEISTRFEVNPCKPFGFSTWCTEGRLQNVRLRKLRPEEVEAVRREAEEEESQWVR